MTSPTLTSIAILIAALTLTSTAHAATYEINPGDDLNPGGAGNGDLRLLDLFGPRPAVTPKQFHVRATNEGRQIPLMELKARECKWPVNDPAPGEVHLFCGEAADGSYCAHHKARSISNYAPNPLKTQAKSAILHGPTGG